MRHGALPQCEQRERNEHSDPVPAFRRRGCPGTPDKKALNDIDFSASPYPCEKFLASLLLVDDTTKYRRSIAPRKKDHARSRQDIVCYVST
jgi:hypothetical protein